MIIVDVMGGYGNQLFQICLALFFKKPITKKVLMDILIKYYRDTIKMNLLKKVPPVQKKIKNKQFKKLIMLKKS